MTVPDPMDKPVMVVSYVLVVSEAGLGKEIKEPDEEKFTLVIVPLLETIDTLSATL